MALDQPQKSKVALRILVVLAYLNIKKFNEL
jgi:hypothetical protein